MNPEIQKWILDNLNQTKDFVLTQAPDVVQQYLEMKFTEALMWALVESFFIFILFCFLVWLFVTLKKQREEIEDEVKAVICFLTVMFIIVLGLCSLDNFRDCYAIKHYPKAYLLKQTGLMK